MIPLIHPSLRGRGGLCLVGFKGHPKTFPVGQGELLCSALGCLAWGTPPWGWAPGADGYFGAHLQVIVMSSHETIRVLEVGVDTPLPAEEDRKPLEMPPGEVARSSPGKTGHPGREEVPPSTQSSCSGEAAGKTPSFPGAHSLGCPWSVHPCK